MRVIPWARCAMGPHDFTIKMSYYHSSKWVFSQWTSRQVTSAGDWLWKNNVLFYASLELWSFLPLCRLRICIENKYYIGSIAAWYVSLIKRNLIMKSDLWNNNNLICDIVNNVLLLVYQSHSKMNKHSWLLSYMTTKTSDHEIGL